MTADLVEAGVGRVAEHLGADVELTSVVVDHSDRVAFHAATADRKLFVKVQSSDERCRREVSALGTAAAAGVPVPAVLLVACEPGAAVLALEAVEGRPLRPGDDEGWVAAGTAIRLAHDAPVPAELLRADVHPWREQCGRWAESFAARGAAEGLVDADAAARMGQWLVHTFDEMAEPPVRFVHGDLQPDHVLLDDHGLRAIVDWGDAGVGDPLWDLTVLTLDSPERLGDVVGGYEPDSSLRAHIEIHHDAYRLLRYLMEVIWLLDHGFDPAESVRGALALDPAGR